MSNVTRRELLQLAAAASISKGIRAKAGASQETGSSTTEQLYSLSPIEVYTNTLSAEAGEDVTLHVSTTAKRFKLEIACVGLEEIVVWTQEHLRGAFHPTPHDAWEKGCRWPVSARLKIPADWKSGYYQIKAITADEGEPSKEYFAFVVVRVVVRALKPTAKTLLVLATNTYGAYNNYGGACLYVTRDGRITGLSGTSGEHRVSFQRPWMPGFLWKPASYDADAEISDGNSFDWSDNRSMNKTSGIAYNACAAGFHNWERVMVSWLEKNGYTNDYAVSSDLELHPELLGRYRLMLSVGHDEYWSWGMRDAVESFVTKGGNVCFFSGDIASWQARFEEQGHALVSYKDNYRDDPYFKAGQKERATGYWSSHHVGRPETHMTGLSAWYGGFSRFRGVVAQGPGGYLIYRPEHWVLTGSGLDYGDCLGQISKIVHYEVDGCPIRMQDGLPRPDDFYDGPGTLEILGMVPASFGKESITALAKEVFGEANPQAIGYVSAKRGHAVMSIFTHNGTVFCAGTTDWTRGLTGQDPAVERVTKNLIDRLSA